MLIITTATNCVDINQDTHPLNSIRIHTMNNKLKLVSINGDTIVDFTPIDEISINGTIHATLALCKAALKLVIYDALS